MKDKIMITIVKSLRERVKKYSMETGVSVSGIHAIALIEYLDGKKSVPDKKKKPVVRQCGVVTCMKPYDTAELSACPKCGSASLYEENKIV